MTGPVRIQRRRTAGWRMPEGAVYVGRGSRWGNPYVVHEHTGRCGEDLEHCDVLLPVSSRAAAARSFQHALDYPLIGGPAMPHPDDVRAELAGKTLVCWCPVDEPCHADVLLRLANPEVAP